VIKLKAASESQEKLYGEKLETKPADSAKI
jgi:hypothetical protein